MWTYRNDRAKGLKQGSQRVNATIKQIMVIMQTNKKNPVYSMLSLNGIDEFKYIYIDWSC